MAEKQLIKSQQEQINMLEEMLSTQKVLTQTYKDHCEVLQHQVDEALDLISRSQQIIYFYQNNL
jgi:hypothetical protein